MRRQRPPIERPKTPTRAPAPGRGARGKRGPGRGRRGDDRGLDPGRRGDRGLDPGRRGYRGFGHASLVVAAGVLVLLVVGAVLLLAPGVGGGPEAARLQEGEKPPEDVRRPGAEPRPERRRADAGDVAILEDDCSLDHHELHPTKQARSDTPWTPAKVGFSLQFGDEVSPYKLIAASVLPGETLEVEAVLTDPGAEYTAEAEGDGTLEATGPESWRWTLPEEVGSYCLRVTEVGSGEDICVRAFVMHPYHGQDVLNGYRIGRYEREPFRGLDEYTVPEGFIEVHPEDLDTWVSPHFQLGQFLCKQEAGWPRYLRVRTRMLLKLEKLLEEVNERGIPADSFYVMSGYRTPWYNAAIGNRTTYSRHAYGDAADVFVDLDRDGLMDDIDGSGRMDLGDARLLQRIVRDMTDETWYRPFVGGLGLYGPTASHPPFLHVDTRGYPARW